MNKGMGIEAETDAAASVSGKRFEEGVDFYYEKGLMVLTEKFLRDRGYCCGNGCRHCPYPDSERPPRQRR